MDAWNPPPLPTCVPPPRHAGPPLVIPPSSCPDLFRAPMGAATSPARPPCTRRGCMGGRNKSGHDEGGRMRTHGRGRENRLRPASSSCLPPLVIPPPLPTCVPPPRHAGPPLVIPPSSCPDLFRAPMGAATSPARPPCTRRGCMGGRNKSGHDEGERMPTHERGRENRLLPASSSCLPPLVIPPPLPTCVPPPRHAGPPLVIPPLVMPGLVPGTHGRRHRSRPAAMRAARLHGWPEQVRP